MGKIYLEVVTPESMVVSREVDSVVAPGTLGQFGILKNHIPFLTGIVTGEMRFMADGQEECVSVASGFAEVSRNRMSVLVDSAELACDIDLERARKALERARARLEAKKGKEDVDYLRAEAALKRALTRIRVAEKSI